VVYARAELPIPKRIEAASRLIHTELADGIFVIMAESGATELCRKLADDEEKMDCVRKNPTRLFAGYQDVDDADRLYRDLRCAR
jgi:hypothetical protein